MGLFSKKQQIVINLALQQPEEPKPSQRKIYLTAEQKKLMKQGAVIDSEGNIYVKDTIWIPDEPGNKIYHKRDFCNGRYSGIPYIEQEAVRRELHRCPYCFKGGKATCAPTDRPYKPCTPIGFIEGYTIDAILI